ncbi:MAG: hypothetical protein IJ740_15920 [Ruminococcus sp.]|nr:hypothetical protein [Ruminococcus sp.]
MKSIVNEQRGYVPTVPFEDDHPKMFIGRAQRDNRLDVPDSCEYAVNDETFD